MFNNLRDENEGSELYNSARKTKVTVPYEPNLLSEERSKLHSDIVSTEDKILNELNSRGPFKARPLNRKLFEPVEPILEKVVSRQESTKF